MGNSGKCFAGLIFVALSVMSSCSQSGTKTETRYHKNKSLDTNTELTSEEWKNVLGEDQFSRSISLLGLDNMNLLAYGMGSSNAVTLLNNLSDVSKISTILSGTDKVEATTLVDLINQIDWHIREGRFVNSNDTLAKTYNLVNSINNATSLKAVINGVSHNSQDTAGFNPIQRLALLVSMTNESTGTVASLLNGVVSPGGVIDNHGLNNLLGVINGTNNILRLTSLINNLNSVNATIDIMRNLDSTGVVRGVELLNHTNDLTPKLSYAINRLNTSGALQNSDSFATDTLGVMPANTHNWSGWSNTPNSFSLVETGVGRNISFSVNSITNGKYFVLSNRMNLSSAGAITFTLNVPVLSGGAVKVFLGTNEIVSYTTPGIKNVNIAASSGIHTLKILTYGNAGSSGNLMLYNFQAPGTQGFDRTPGAKAAILLNKINLNGAATLTVLLNDLPDPVLNPTAINNLVTIIDRAHYPSDLNADPKMVQLVNGLSSTALMIDVLSNINTKAAVQLTEIINFGTNIGMVVSFVNLLHAANAAKVTAILNSLNATATSSIIEVLSYPTTDVTELVTLVNGISNVSHYSTILTTLSPMHYSIFIDNGNIVHKISAEWSGGRKLAEILSQIKSNTDLSISEHGIRLSDDIAAGTGASSLASVINGLDPSAPTFSGMTRMTNLIWRLRRFGSPRYDHPFDLSDGGVDHTFGGNSASSDDHFGRLTTLASSISSGGSDTMAAMVNYTDYASFDKLEQLVRDSRRIQYVADMANKLQNIQLLTNAIPTVDMTKMLEILNGIGDSNQRGSGIKNVGDMFIFADSMNQLGYNSNGTPRDLTSQLKIVSLINNVIYCGIKQDTELSSGPTYISEKDPTCEQASDRTRKRATNVMLGLENGKPLAVIAGDINDIQKGITLMNGMRDVRKLIHLVNIVPPQVMVAHLNEISISGTYGNALQRSLLYLLNRLAPFDVAKMVHYGTGIGKGSRWKKCVDWFGVPYDKGYVEDWQNCTNNVFPATYHHYKNDRRSTNSGCNYYRAFGPKRLAKILNSEQGTTMEALLNKFGVRTAIAALGCGFAGTQTLHGSYASVVIPSNESITIHRSAGNYTHWYHASTQGACSTNYTGGIAHGTNTWDVNRRGYFPEVMVSANWYPVWAVDPHYPWFVDLIGLGTRVVDQLLHNNMANMWGIITCTGFIGSAVCGLDGGVPVPPKSARIVQHASDGNGVDYWANEIAEDCDVLPYHDSTTGWTTAVSDGGPASN